MHLTSYRGTRRATSARPSFLEIRGRLATPGYVGIRRRPDSHTAATATVLTEADTLVISTVSR